MSNLCDISHRRIPDKVQRLLEMLMDSGYEAYIVGGCVRDLILDIEPKDWDITTNATPEQVKTCFRGYPVYDTGLKHGTVTIRFDEENFEVTTYRTESDYSDGRHPDKVAFTTSLTDDLARRDFTMNAIAVSRYNQIVDPFHGVDDIQHRIIRCVGEPNERFHEDPLRILRALRFASKYSFRIELNTGRAMREMKSRLALVSAERINKEFTEILCGHKPSYVLSCYREVIAEFIPEIQDCFDFQQNTPYHRYDVYQHIIHAVDEAPEDPIIRLAMFYHDIGKPRCYTEDEDGIGHFYGHPQISADIAEERMRMLRFSNKDIAAVKDLVLHHHDHSKDVSKRRLLRFLNKMGPEQTRRLLDVNEADLSAQSKFSYDKSIDVVRKEKALLETILAEKAAFSIKDLAVNGHDLIDAGFTPGPVMGECFREMTNRVIDGYLPNEKTALLEWAMRFLQYWQIGHTPAIRRGEGKSSSRLLNNRA